LLHAEGAGGYPAPGREQKHQAPNDKFQTMTETTKSNAQNGGPSPLPGRFDHSAFSSSLDLFGICDLVLGAFARSFTSEVRRSQTQVI